MKPRLSARQPKPPSADWGAVVLRRDPGAPRDCSGRAAGPGGAALAVRRARARCFGLADRRRRAGARARGRRRARTAFDAGGQRGAGSGPGRAHTSPSGVELGGGLGKSPATSFERKARASATKSGVRGQVALDGARDRRAADAWNWPGWWKQTGLRRPLRRGALPSSSASRSAVVRGALPVARGRGSLKCHEPWF